MKKKVTKKLSSYKIAVREPNRTVTPEEGSFPEQFDLEDRKINYYFIMNDS